MSRLRATDVLAELTAWHHAESDLTKTRNQCIRNSFRKEESQPCLSLFRGVGRSSPHWLAASQGIATIDSRWVQRDYLCFQLPSASYWSDFSLERFEAFWALGHAFGGDHPEPWEKAQEGIVLVRKFFLNECRVRPSNVQLQVQSTAWKLPAGRDEYLVFAETKDCKFFHPWSLVRNAFASDNDAEIVLCTAYLDYLIHESQNGINPGLAKDLLREYQTTAPY